MNTNSPQMGRNGAGKRFVIQDALCTIKTISNDCGLNSEVQTMSEEWKTIKDFPNYEVSNTGKVRSLNYNNTGKVRELKPRDAGNGYLSVGLCRNGKQKSIKLHRLVAELFIPNIRNKLEINHKDGNKANNAADNLEWVSRSENQKHAYDNGLKENVRKAVIELNKRKRIKVIAVGDDGSKREYQSQSEAAKELGVKQAEISAALKGKRKSVGGYKWIYA